MIITPRFLLTQPMICVELALALAAVITAVTGLFGIVATQVWRRREENRNDKTHALELERERLELERERLKLEQDRLELERQRHADRRQDVEP
ncbi:MAG: hypothetical protein R3C44_19055 [Chloroflexota bacterium]